MEECEGWILRDLNSITIEKLLKQTNKKTGRNIIIILNYVDKYRKKQ